MPCVRDMAREMADLKRSMDRDEPGWAETTVWCYWHRERHTLVSEERQLQLPPGISVEPAPTRGHRLPPLPANAPEGYCRWHKTPSPELSAPCAWETCRRPVHVHQDALGAVKSGRAAQGYLVERCPVCHRYNAVFPVYGKRAVRTSKLADGAPVLQLTMGGR